MTKFLVLMGLRFVCLYVYVCVYTCVCDMGAYVQCIAGIETVVSEIVMFNEAVLLACG